MDWLDKLSRRKFIKLASGTVVGISFFSIFSCSQSFEKQVNISNEAKVENEYTSVFPQHEAGLIANVPSKTIYYNGNKQIIKNLGVHEHWNNPQEKKHSCNLGKTEGIEFIINKSNCKFVHFSCSFIIIVILYHLYKLIKTMMKTVDRRKTLQRTV